MDRIEPGNRWFSLEEDVIALERKIVELELQREELKEKIRRRERQEHILSTLMWIFLGLIIYSLLTFAAQGLHLGGFNLDTEILLWLGGATVGEVAGLLSIVISAYFDIRQAGQKSQAAPPQTVPSKPQ